MTSCRLRLMLLRATWPNGHIHTYLPTCARARGIIRADEPVSLAHIKAKKRRQHKTVTRPVLPSPRWVLNYRKPPEDGSATSGIVFSDCYLELLPANGTRWLEVW